MKNKSIISVEALQSPWQTLDPFLFSVHHKDNYPNGNEKMQPVASLEGRNIGQDFSGKDGWSMYHGQKIPGFPYHPHRGFETLTITEKGLIDHTDSLNTGGRFGDGDVQWMTAGNGVQHSEMFPMLNKQGGNAMEFFQVWLNLPAKSKNVPAEYKMLWHEDIPFFNHTDSNGKKTSVKVVVGALNGVKPISPITNSWASDADNEVGIWIIKMEANATWKLPKASKKINRALYVYKANTIIINDSKLNNYQKVEVDSLEDLELIAGDKPVSMLLLQGKPIDEPVAKYGPFVMNTDRELEESFALYRKTEFGGWPWPKREYVFPKNKEGLHNMQMGA